jgi:hypothetical protein
MKIATFAILCMVCFGCGSAGETNTKNDSVALAASVAPLRNRPAAKDSTRNEQPALADGEVRVPLFVLPGDAAVEVNDVLVRRRNGTVELVGKIGDERRVRVFIGSMRTEEKVVKIEELGTSPPMIDARVVFVSH